MSVFEVKAYADDMSLGTTLNYLDSCNERNLQALYFIRSTNVHLITEPPISCKFS